MLSQIRSFFTMSSYFTQWRWHQLSSRRRVSRLSTPAPLESRILLTTRTWTGGAISNDKWTDKDNWSGDIAPVSGDDVVFPAGIGALDRGTNNDIANLTLKSIRFEGGDFKLTGNSIKLTGDITVLPSLAASTIEFQVSMTVATHVINVANTSRLNFNGRLNDFSTTVNPGLFVKTGSGVLTFGGTNTNTLDIPLRVEQGELVFRKTDGVTAFSGPLTIGGGLSGPAGVAKVTIEVVNSANPLNPVNSLVNLSAVTINETFDGVGVFENSAGTLRIANLTLRGGRIQGGGVLQLGGDVSVQNSPQTARLDIASLDLGDSQRRLKIGSGAELRITSKIGSFSNFNSSVQGFIQDLLFNDGGGKLILFPTSDNTYQGRTVVRAGRLEINAAVAGRTVIPGDVVVGSTASPVSELRSTGENLIADTASIRLISNGRFVQTIGSETIGSLDILETGKLTALAPTPKVFRVLGKTTVSEQGQFEAGNRSDVLFEDDVRVLGGTITADQAKITFRRNLILRGGRAETLPSAVDNTLGILFFERSIATEASPNPSTIAGRVQFKASPLQVIAHRLDVVDGAALNDLVIDAAIEQSSSTKKLFKAALGKLVINGNNTASNLIEHAAGTLLINGQQLQSDVNVVGVASNPAGPNVILGGIGAIRSLTMNGGTLAPGLSPGLLSSFRMTLVGPAKLQVELNGVAPFTQHDQVNMFDFHLGVANANFPTLEVLVGFTTALNQTFEIADVRNDSGTLGKFKDTAGNVLNEGSTFIAGGVGFQISYLGGDGNDITIKRVSTSPAFENRSITRVVREGEFATLQGLITEADSEDTFFLDVNWGDGTSETFTFAPGSPRQIAVTHQYLDDGRTGFRNERKKGSSDYLGGMGLKVRTC